MEIKNLSEKENPLFNRREISFDVEKDTTPSREEIMNLVSEKFSITPEKIKIKSIDGKFGTNYFNVSVFLYASEEDKKQTEIKKKKDEELMKKLNEPKQEEKSEETESEKPAETPSEEKADDSKKEETQDENKSEEVKE